MYIPKKKKDNVSYFLILILVLLSRLLL